MTHPDHDPLSTAIKTHAPRYTAPPQLADRIMAALPHPAQKQKTPWLTKLSWGGSAMALAASIALFSLTPSSTDILMQDLVGAHARSLITGHLIDIETSDRHVVKPWFNGKAPLSPPVVDLAEQGFPLVGGRLDYVADQTTPALIYRHAAHFINVFLWVSQGADQSLKSLPQRDGYNGLTWRVSGITYAAISDVNPSDLKEFQTVFAAKANQ